MFWRCALASLVVLTQLSTATARGSSLQTISPSHCVWRAGDDAGWATPGLDESGWQPLSSWKITAGQTSMWVRCHANLDALRQASHPALQVNAASAYQLFLNGRLIGQNGNLGSGQASIDKEQTFSIAANDLASGTDTVALRMTVRRIVDPPAFAAGEADWLRAQRNSDSLAGAKQFLAVAVGFGVIGVLAFFLLALYLNDRSHLELLLLAIAVMGLSALRLSDFSWAAMAPLPGWMYWTVHALGEAGIVAFVWFMFRLAGRRVPLLYKLLLALALSWAIHDVFSAWFPANVSLWSDSLYLRWAPLLHIAGIALTTAPFVAFWPWPRIARNMRAMAICAMLWGFMDLVWFAVLVYYDLNPADAQFQQWRPVLLELRAFGTIAAIIALIALLFREYRRTAEERAVLAGEMQAAQQIQRILAPAAVDTAAGARVEVAFRPMRDVGGDFYLCRALPDGRQRILIGDVSGKGAAAAMTATLLIGAAERRNADSPAELLAHLNLVLHASQVGGFATCLCADLEPDGTMTLANAGHLSPYLHGEEIATPPGLPLGLSASHGIYDELRFHLAEGDTLTFMSDGVAEARSETGELFGFERTQAMSVQTAEAIADAAEKYGQQDDITVLTLTRAPKPTPKLGMAAASEVA
jgi:hypothetical protein